MDERIRYINIRMIGLFSLTEKDAWHVISTEIRRLVGAAGAADIGLFLAFFDPKSQGGIFRVAHRYIHRVRGALCFIQKWNQNPIFTYSENVSGTLKTAKKELLSAGHLHRASVLTKIFHNYWKSSFDDD
ncbi:MAG: Rpp14/Pop5 family protein [Candidatus Heimdallarchaeota archaeon]